MNSELTTLDQCIFIEIETSTQFYTFDLFLFLLILWICHFENKILSSKEYFFSEGKTFKNDISITLNIYGISYMRKNEMSLRWKWNMIFERHLVAQMNRTQKSYANDIWKTNWGQVWNGMILEFIIIIVWKYVIDLLFALHQIEYGILKVNCESVCEQCAVCPGYYASNFLRSSFETIHANDNWINQQNNNNNNDDEERTLFIAYVYGVWAR